MNSIKDPGSGGTIVVPQVHQGVLEVTSAGTRTFESAAFHPVGLEVFVISQASCTVQSVSLTDGQFVKFIVSKNSAGVHEWVLEAVDSDIANTSFADDAELTFGTGDDVAIGWETGDASNHTFVVGLGDTNQAIHITDKAAIGTDWNVSADTHSTVYLHSNTTPATDYLLIGGHDGTTAGIDVAGGTTLDLRIAGTDVAVLDAGGFTFADNVGVAFGTGDDAAISWDATNLVYDVDSGVHNFTVATSSIAQIGATGITLQDAGDAYRGQGSTIAWIAPIAAQQDLSGAGAITVTEYYTAWTTTGVDAGTLADGAQVGQVKKIQLIVVGGDGTLTPDNLSGGTTITFADAGDYAVLQWDGSNWVAIELGNDADGATAPVLA